MWDPAFRYYGTIPTSVTDADGIAFIQGMKAAVEDNQPQTSFREYGTTFIYARHQKMD